MRWKRIVISALFLGIGLGLSFPYLLPLTLHTIRPDIVFRGDRNARIVYLTIDDSPSSSTNDILLVLKKHDVEATFFVTADHINTPSQLESIVQHGHLIGNHLRTTAPASKISFEQFVADFQSCKTAIKAHSDTRLFRPSGDFGSDEQIQYVSRNRHTSIMGTAFPLDHWISAPWIIERLATYLTIPGGIIILHDGAERGHTTAIILDNLIPRLRGRGYEFRSLSELQDRGTNRNAP